MRLLGTPAGVSFFGSFCAPPGTPGEAKGERPGLLFTTAGHLNSEGAREGKNDCRPLVSAWGAARCQGEDAGCFCGLRCLVLSSQGSAGRAGRLCTPAFFGAFAGKGNLTVCEGFYDETSAKTGDQP